MTAIFKELDNTDQKWEYAKLTELAFEHGGQSNLLKIFIRMALKMVLMLVVFKVMKRVIKRDTK